MQVASILGFVCEGSSQAQDNKLSQVRCCMEYPPRFFEARERSLYREELPMVENPETRGGGSGYVIGSSKNRWESHQG